MKAYFAGQCGALLGSVVGLGVGKAINHYKHGNPADQVFEYDSAREQDKHDTISACAIVGFALGGLVGVYIGSKD